MLQYIGPVLGIASAIVTLYAFYKNKIKHNVLLLVASLIFSSVIVVVWNIQKEKAYDRA